MEFCSEGPLTKFIRANTDITKRDKWVVDLARGLQHIHSMLVIHRDIKPDNLLIAVDSSGHQTVKYIDFGLAVELNDRESTIDDGKQAGTPSYMSPELDARKAYSFATDIWSLGVVLLQVGSWGGILSSSRPGVESLALRCHSGLHWRIGAGFDDERAPQIPQDNAGRREPDWGGYSGISRRFECRTDP